MSKNISKQWPKGELEFLDCCPLCKSPKSRKIYEDLEDKVFFCAPGKWNLYKCEKCDLVQFKSLAPLDEMYGQTYGYRTSLSNLMVTHIKNKSLASILR